LEKNVKLLGFWIGAMHPMEIGILLLGYI